MRALYDEFADDYNDTLAKWQYQAPSIIAGYLQKYCTIKASALDAGCGTGLMGAVLKREGFAPITGFDLSPKSVNLANKTGYYQKTQVHDVLTPLPFKSESFSAIVCAGVLSYIADSERVLRELLRVACTGGIIAFTQREDLYQQRNDEALFASLHSEGLFDWQENSEPQAYLPNHPEFSNVIQAHYFVWRKR